MAHSMRLSLSKVESTGEDCRTMRKKRKCPSEVVSSACPGPAKILLSSSDREYKLDLNSIQARSARFFAWILSTSPASAASASSAKTVAGSSVRSSASPAILIPATGSATSLATDSATGAPISAPPLTSPSAPGLVSGKDFNSSMAMAPPCRDLLGYPPAILAQYLSWCAMPDPALSNLPLF